MGGVGGLSPPRRPRVSGAHEVRLTTKSELLAIRNALQRIFNLKKQAGRVPAYNSQSYLYYKQRTMGGGVVFRFNELALQRILTTKSELLAIRNALQRIFNLKKQAGRVPAYNSQSYLYYKQRTMGEVLFSGLMSLRFSAS